MMFLSGSDCGSGFRFIQLRRIRIIGHNNVFSDVEYFDQYKEMFMTV
jgi:hypothetical protein